MRKIVFFGALALLAALGPLAAQTRLNHFSPTGQALFKGSDLNLIVDSVNNLQGTGAPGAITGTTGVFSGAVSTAALASSGAVTNTGFDLNATANTVQVGTLVATTGVTTLAAGDRLSVDYANTIQSSAGVVVTVSLAPL